MYASHTRTARQSEFSRETEETYPERGVEGETETETKGQTERHRERHRERQRERERLVIRHWLACR